MGLFGTKKKLPTTENATDAEQGAAVSIQARVRGKKVRILRTAAG